jgi:hypothetical protein
MTRRVYKGQHISASGTEILRDGALAVDLATNTLYIHDGSTPGGVALTGDQKVSSLANQDVEVTLGVIGIKIINSSGCYVQIRATSSLTAHYNNVYNSTGATGDDNGSLSLTTSFVNFPNTALNAIGSKVDALIKIDSLEVAYRIQILTGSGSAPYNSNLVVIEQVL